MLNRHKLSTTGDTEDTEIKPHRIFDIRPDRFSWTADESADEGKTWTNGVNQIEARRIGPPRKMHALARSK